jgi:hypothetical protein
MKQMFLLFSHTLTQAQKDDAKNFLSIKSFVELPHDLQNLWSDIPADLKNISLYLNPLKEFLKNNAKKDDIVLVQGDFCAVYEIVDFSKNIGLIPVCSTTKREVKELIKDNKVIKTSTFRHVIYRRY